LLPATDDATKALIDNMEALGKMGASVVDITAGAFNWVAGGILGIVTLVLQGIDKLMLGAEKLAGVIPGMQGIADAIAGAREGLAFHIEVFEGATTQALQGAVSRFRRAFGIGQAAVEPAAGGAPTRRGGGPGAGAGGAGAGAAAADAESSPAVTQARDISSLLLEIEREHATLAMTEKQKELADLENWYVDKALVVGANEEAQTQLWEIHNAKRAEIVQKYREQEMAQAQRAHDMEVSASKRAVTQQLRGLMALTQGQKEYIGLYKAAAVAQAVMDTYASANAAFKAMAGIPYVGPALGAAAAALAVGLGVANVAKISATKFATGGDFVTAGPQMIMVGDNPGGRERVQVTPLSSENINGPQGAQINAPLVVEGNVDADFMPALREAHEAHLERVRETIVELQFRGQLTGV